MTQNKYNKGDQVQIANGDWVTITGYGLDDVRFSCDKYDFTLHTGLITDHRPVFDWKKLKWGMCFRDLTSDHDLLFWYVGKTLEGTALMQDEHGIIGEDDITDVPYNTVYTRHPEGDISSETVVAASNESTEV